MSSNGIRALGTDGFVRADGIAITADSIGYSSNNYVDSSEWMEFRANAYEIYLMNTHSALHMTQTEAILRRSWLASPYTNITADPSEIVTKQDLINLGLISA